MPDPILDALDEVQRGSGRRDPVLDALDEVQGDDRSTFARGYDAAFTAPKFITDAAAAGADYIDEPSTTRSPMRARVEGFAAGALEGAASLLTPGDAVLTALGLRPVRDALRAVRGGERALRTVHRAADVATMTRGTERVTTSDDDLSELLAGGAQLALGGANVAASRRALGPTAEVVPAQRPQRALPAARRFVVDEHGRVADDFAGDDIDELLEQAHNVTADTARRHRRPLPLPAGEPAASPRALLPPGREPRFVADEAGRVADRPAGDNLEDLDRFIAGMDDARDQARPPRQLGPGPRFVADEGGRVADTAAGDDSLRTVGLEDASPAPRRTRPATRSTRAAVLARDIDATVPAREAVRVRQYSSDPDAVDAPFLDDAVRRELERARTELDEFRPQRGRLFADPNDRASGIYAPGVRGARFADDVRVVSEQHVSNAEVARAIDDLLEGKPPTNRLHTAAIDAAGGRLEGRPGYSRPDMPHDVADELRQRGGGEVSEYERFAAAFDDVAYAPTRGGDGRDPGEEGFVSTQLAAHVGSGIAGAAAGAAAGEDTDDKIAKATLFGLAGAVAPALLRRPGAARTLTAAGGRDNVASLQPRGGVPNNPGRSGRANPDPMQGTDPFLRKFANPLVREGVRNLLTEHNGYASQRRGVIDSETLGKFAEEVKVNASKVLPKGTALNAEQMTAYARALERTQSRVQRLGALVNAGRATDADLAAFQAARAEADVIGKSLMGARSEAGRALAAMNFWRGVMDTGNVDIIRDALKAPGLRGDAEQLAKGLAAQPNDPIARYRWLQGQKSATLSEKIRSFYYSNILSGIKTHERNLVGNVANLASHLVVHPAAAGIDAARSAIHGAPRTVRLEELPAQVVGAVAGVERGFKDFVFAMRHGMAPATLRRGLEAGQQGKLDVPRVEFSGGGLNPLNIPGRLLDASDAFVRSIARNLEAYGLAHTQAKSEGLTGARFDTRVAELRAGQSPEGVQLLEQADTFAQRSVFQEDPGELVRRIQGVVNWSPLFSFIVPFVKTPANILRQGLEFSPGGVFMPAAREAGRKGAQAQGRAAVGAAAAGALAWLASTGRLSGDGPQDREKRQALMESGWRPNSVRIGDRWVEYSLFQPVSVHAAMIANAFEGWAEAGAKPDGLDVALSTVRRSMKSFISQSFLSGLYDFLEGLDEDRSFQSAIARTASGLVPLAGAVRSVQQASDPVVRKPEGWKEQLAAGIPGASTRLTPRLDRFGEEVMREGGPVKRAADPFNATTVRRDSVSDELTRLGIDLALPTDELALPAGQQLTRDQSFELRQAKGRGVRERLEILMDADRYAEWDDETRRRRVKREIDRARDRAGRRFRRSVRDAGSNDLGALGIEELGR